MRIEDFKNAGKVLKTQTFTASGTFTKPTGVSHVIVDMCGSGAGGGAAVGNGLASGGGSGQFVKDRFIDLSSAATYTITVAQASSPGSAGGVSSFGALLSVSGGVLNGGEYGYIIPSGGTSYAKNGDGQDCPGFGSGGSGAYSNGPVVNGTNGNGFGAGGGAGSSASGSNVAIGGSGAPGIVIVKWFE